MVVALTEHIVLDTCSSHLEGVRIASHEQKTVIKSNHMYRGIISRARA